MSYFQGLYLNNGLRDGLTLRHKATICVKRGFDMHIGYLNT